MNADTAACPKRQAAFLRVAMNHAQTRQMAADGSLLTIGWQMDWMHTANAAIVPSRRRRDLPAWLIKGREITYE